MSSHVDRVREFIRAHERIVGKNTESDFVAGVFDPTTKTPHSLRRADLDALCRDAERLAQVEDI